jgi:sterol 14-demethylase
MRYSDESCLSASWALLYLGNNPSWKIKAIDELKALLASHSQNLSTDYLHKQLASIPLQAWEDETPVLETVIRETLRLTMTGAPSRRIVFNDLQIGGLTVKMGDFIVYSQADAHLNPEIYLNPQAFDPDRYSLGREEDRKQANAYLAWGSGNRFSVRCVFSLDNVFSGRHPCAGMKVARLEIKLVLAALLLGFDYRLVDGTGHCADILPQPDRNDLHQVSFIYKGITRTYAFASLGPLETLFTLNSNAWLISRLFSKFHLYFTQ